MAVLSIALKNLSRRKLRAFIMILIIMVVTGAFVSIVSVRSDIRTTDVGQETSKTLSYHIKLSDSSYVTDGVLTDPDDYDYPTVDSAVISDISKIWGSSVVFDPRIQSKNILVRTNDSGNPHTYNNTAQSFCSLLLPYVW